MLTSCVIRLHSRSHVWARSMVALPFRSPGHCTIFSLPLPNDGSAWVSANSASAGAKSKTSTGRASHLRDRTQGQCVSLTLLSPWRPCDAIDPMWGLLGPSSDHWAIYTYVYMYIYIYVYSIYIYVCISVLLYIYIVRWVYKPSHNCGRGPPHLGSRP